ncbi:MAG: DUF1616 domain-containing protein [Candidatus Bathyarchaeota archaeon]|nr:DUF1616 domain-containing protein [Candidatus Bathyarchaeota archaeon]
MKLRTYKLFFITAGLIGILILSSPAISAYVTFPGDEPFSEIYILGSGHMTEGIPFNIQPDTDYEVQLGVGNHMGSPFYYVCYIYLRNATQSFPDITAGTPSGLPPLYEYRVLLQDEQTVELPLVFSLSGFTAANNQSTLQSLTINNVTFDVDATALWDSEKNGFPYQLLLELWAFNQTEGSIQYHQRAVYFWLNVTSAV